MRLDTQYHLHRLRGMAVAPAGPCCAWGAMYAQPWQTVLLCVAGAAYLT